MQPIPSPRPDWPVQVLVLALVALVGTVPFWLTDLDLWVAARFYRPGTDNPWSAAETPLWSFLYLTAPLLTGAVVLGGLLVLAGGRLWAWMGRLRPYAVLAIATTLLGPGLLVNGVFKDQWGRPRPHQVEALGGTRPYLPPLMRGEPGKGKSFPSGHSSVGYSLALFFPIWLRRRPRLAWAALALAVGLGTLLGIGRMAAGDHFLSDVIWSAVFSYGVALALYYGVLRIPRWEASLARRPPSDQTALRHPWAARLGFWGSAAAMLAVVLLASPVNQNHREVVRSGEFPGDPRALAIVADQADLTLYWIGGPERAALKLEARGFGLPFSRVEQTLTAGSDTLVYRIAHLGVFTERDTSLVVGLDADQWDRISVRLGSGNLRLYARPRPGPILDLETARGEVRELSPQ